MHNKIQQYKRMHVNPCSLRRLNLITCLNSNKNTIFYGSCADYKRGNYYHIYDLYIRQFSLMSCTDNSKYRGRRLCILKELMWWIKDFTQLLPLALFTIVCTHHMIILYNITFKKYI